MAELTNSDLPLASGKVLPKGTIHFARRTFLYESACYERVQMANYGLEPVTGVVTLHLDTDFADVFEVRGTHREQRGERLEPHLGRDGLTLRYRGRDGARRETRVTADPPPAEVKPGLLTFRVALHPGEVVTLFLTIACASQTAPAHTSPYDEALALARSERTSMPFERCRVTSSSYLFNEWLGRAASDLEMLITETPYGPYPYAGIPWFSTPFGRDGIITAMQMLWLDPSVARGVLEYLSATQATGFDPARDAQPGKILHESRLGEMAALGEVPFGRYYGSVDATPLFVMLAGRYFKRTNDRAVIERLWRHIELALEWMERYGDADGDGFIEYQRENEDGLVQQGWKDSWDSVFHADGELAEPPIALCEVQGYAYAARREAADIASALGMTERAAQLTARAEELQRRFETAFWCEPIETYALALDRHKRPCAVRTSNPGHCLFSGIVSRRHRRKTAESLLADDMFSGWGVRTLGAAERRYNPMSYHNGSVWPHDNGILASGLAQCGLRDLALKIFTGLFDSALHMDLHRLPELFCGFARRADEGPTGYPVACKPQAWAAGAVFMLLESALGLDIDARTREVTFTHPALPRWLQRLRIENLWLSPRDGISLQIERHAHGVGIAVTSRRGNVTITKRE